MAYNNGAGIENYTVESFNHQFVPQVPEEISTHNDEFCSNDTTTEISFKDSK